MDQDRVRFLVHLPESPPLSCVVRDNIIIATHKHHLEVQPSPTQRYVKHVCSPNDNGRQHRSTWTRRSSRDHRRSRDSFCSSDNSSRDRSRSYNTTGDDSSSASTRPRRRSCCSRRSRSSPACARACPRRWPTCRRRSTRSSRSRPTAASG